MMVARSADEAVLSWSSRRGEEYMILFAESRESNARWRPLPGYERVRGTGETIEIRDPVPQNVPRFYRIVTVRPAGPSRK